MNAARDAMPRCFGRRVVRGLKFSRRSVAVDRIVTLEIPAPPEHPCGL
jgi:hypothetical protein